MVFCEGCCSVVASAPDLPVLCCNVLSSVQCTVEEEVTVHTSLARPLSLPPVKLHNCALNQPRIDPLP